MLPHAAAGAAAGGEAAGNSPAIAALHLDLALPLVKQQITWPNFNPISLIKEASDKQKVVCKFVERALPTRPGAYHPQFQQQIIWEGQVSTTAPVPSAGLNTVACNLPPSSPVMPQRVEADGQTVMDSNGAVESFNSSCCYSQGDGSLLQWG